MKQTLLLLIVAIMGCKDSPSPKGNAITGPLPRYSEKQVDSMMADWDRSQTSMNWDSIEIDQHGCLRISRFVSQEEIKIAWDSAVKVQNRNPRPKLKGIFIRK